MNIVVCYKIVPDEEGIAIKADRSVDVSGAQWSLGEYDLEALEAAVQLRDSVGGKVTVLTVGGDEVLNSKLKKSILSRGADDQIVVCSEAFANLDAYCTAEVLARALGSTEYDLVLCGEGSSDIDFDLAEIRTKLLEYKANEFDPELDIASCDTIVCVGNGVKDECLDKYRELAKLLGGKLAGTRPVCDRELLPVKLQVGQSGVMIKPKLYIGFGVSGAVNHVTGVDAEKFIAVNKDASAPIFNYCDYGIVGDMDEVCDAMIAMLKN